VTSFRRLWTWVRDRFRNDADRRLVDPLKDAPVLDARGRRQVNRVQDETLARVTFGLG